MSEKRKLRKLYLTDKEYGLVCGVATDHGRAVAEYMRAAVLAEAKRHIHREGLLTEIKKLVDGRFDELLRELGGKVVSPRGFDRLVPFCEGESDAGKA